MQTLERIMVVEDDPDILDIFEMSLGMLGGFEVRLCENAIDAVNAVPLFKPHLIVLDVMLPGLSGPDALPRIRAQPEGDEIVIVMMTARISTQGKNEYLSLGADEVLFKPFEPTELPSALNAIWEQKQAGCS